MANLLIVDDDPVLLNLLGRLLRQLGHHVTAAGGGADALAPARAQCFDLIVTDLMMPEMDGLTLVRRLRAETACAGSLILLVTSSLEGPNPAAARAAWAAKPIHAGRLAALTTRLLAGQAVPTAAKPEAP